MSERLQRTNEQVFLQAGNPVISFDYDVMLDGEKCEYEWGMLKRNRFDPQAPDPARPFGIFINTCPDDGGNYVTPRWLKFAIREEYRSVIEDSVPAQHAHLRHVGFSKEEAMLMHRLTTVSIDGKQYPGTLSTHFGRSIEAIMKQGSLSIEERNIASAAYALSAIQAIDLAMNPQIINGQDRHVLHSDPNPGNVLMMVRDGRVTVINYDMTNKGRITRKSITDKVISGMYFDYQKGAEVKGLAMPNDINTLFAHKEEYQNILGTPVAINLAYRGLY